jgi:hypothetical protein
MGAIGSLGPPPRQVSGTILLSSGPITGVTSTILDATWKTRRPSTTILTT